MDSRADSRWPEVVLQDGIGPEINYRGCIPAQDKGKRLGRKLRQFGEQMEPVIHG